MQKFQVSPEADESLSKDEYTFTVSPELSVNFVGFKQYTRPDEWTPFFQNPRVWRYPDLQNISTIERPPVPAWVISELKQLILQKLHLEFDLEG